MEQFDPKGKKFLAVSAHADDADFIAGGTMLKWSSLGAKGAIVIVTNGDKGSHDSKISSEELTEIRKKEQLSASGFLGLEKTWFLDYPDAHLEVTQELKEKLVKIIREYQPDIVLTFDPAVFYTLELNFVNHPDHRAVGRATLDACYPLARDFLTFKEQIEQGLTAHCVEELFLYNWDKPNYFEDISQFLNQKMELIGKHESQVNKAFLKQEIEDWASKLGKQVGLKHAESFVRLTLGKN